MVRQCERTIARIRPLSASGVHQQRGPGPLVSRDPVALQPQEQNTHPVPSYLLRLSATLPATMANNKSAPGSGTVCSTLNAEVPSAPIAVMK